MVEILVYAFGVMYTPGPVNLLSLNAGLEGQMRASLGFCLGVGCAMLLLFLAFGYTGAWLLGASWQRWVGLFGCGYILWLAIKLLGASLQSSRALPDDDAGTSGVALTFRSGLLMQLLNPKAPVAILPIVTVQFPAAEISGLAISAWSLLLALMAFGAPGSYLLLGARLGRLIQSPNFFRLFNLAMALLLIYVAADIALQQWLA